MNPTFQFKTNINCSGCIEKVTPVLDQEKGIDNWQVDTANKEKILTVTTALPQTAIIQLVTAAGFKITPVQN